MLKSYGELDPSGWQGQCFFFYMENADIAGANASYENQAVQKKNSCLCIFFQKICSISPEKCISVIFLDKIL